MWAGKFQSIMMWRYGDEMIVEDTIRKHEDHLRQVVPPEKLFWYKVSEGWEPLCRILDLPIPDQPFPHNNSKQDAREIYRECVLAGLVSWVFMLSSFWVAIWYISHWRQGYSVL